MFLSCVALHASCAKTVWIGHVDKGRDALHHFSHSSVKGIVICKSHWHSLCRCSFTKFLRLVSGCVRLKYKWFVQPTLHQEISHCHVAMFPNVLQGPLHCLSCFLLQDDEKFEHQIGNAFQVKGELANAMTLVLLCPSCWLVTISCNATMFAILCCLRVLHSNSSSRC